MRRRAGIAVPDMPKLAANRCISPIATCSGNDKNLNIYIYIYIYIYRIHVLIPFYCAWASGCWSYQTVCIGHGAWYQDLHHLYHWVKSGVRNDLPDFSKMRITQSKRKNQMNARLKQIHAQFKIETAAARPKLTTLTFKHPKNVRRWRRPLNIKQKFRAVKRGSYFQTK